MKQSTLTASAALAACAMSGLLAGSAAAATPSTTGYRNVSPVSQAAVAGILLASGEAGEVGKHDCKGKNACKGQGGCQSGDNGCKGKNSCKGKGGCATNKE